MKKISALTLSAAAYLGTAFPAFGATLEGSICPANPGTTTDVMNFFGLCGLELTGGVLGNILNLVFVVVVILALAFLIYGGIRWITSGGDKTKVEAARNTIVAALIGMVLAFLAYFIIRLVLALFGIEFHGGNFFGELNLFK